LFLHVWLKREEQRVKETLIVAQGLTELISASGGKTTIPAKFKEFVTSVFPFMEKEESSSDAKQKEVLRKEAEKGPIQFAATPINTFKNAAKTLSMSDDFRRKLRDKAAKRDR
jgi:hypothetical protein